MWINTQVRPQEACGTSGMKASGNGVLNLSILDGWWDEAYTPEVGWAIGGRESYADANYQDQVEAEALYGLLEQEVVPMFYERSADGLPRKWIMRMKTSIKQLCRHFTTRRMVGEYIERYYLPAASHGRSMLERDLSVARSLAAWKSRLAGEWPHVKVLSSSTDGFTEIPVGGEFQVLAEVNAGDLSPDELTVELLMGLVGAEGEIREGERTAMTMEGSTTKGTYTYRATAIACRKSGKYGYTIRVTPHHPDLTARFLPGLITWA